VKKNEGALTMKQPPVRTFHPVELKFPRLQSIPKSALQSASVHDESHVFTVGQALQRLVLLDAQGRLLLS
jgi:hypothetical protein